MKKLFSILAAVQAALALAANAPAQAITSQPQSITINTGSTATFTVGAANATNYQWTFDGANISGATNSSLQLEGVSTNEAGSYAVVVNNLETSSNAVLTIVPGTVVTFGLTGFPAGGTSNITVELFNRDKPVTVQNFLHYVTSGAYSNMFIDRDSVGFVLQGGDYMVYDRTNTASPLIGASIGQNATTLSIQPPLSQGIANEAYVGPRIHNDFGTLTMALSSSTNSASSAFFFNTTDNSALLDSTNDGGPFVVFGRIADAASSNTLYYFNTLSNGGGVVATATFFDGFDGETSVIPAFGSLPVNYIGTHAPGNANLLFCDFNVLQPPNATNIPSLSLTSPAANAVFSNSVAFSVQGTATDPNDIGLAWVRCDLIPIAGADGTLPNGGVGITNYTLAPGTNWSISVANALPGTYQLGVQVRDEAGNTSAEQFIQPITDSVILIIGGGSVMLTNGTNANLNAVGYPFQLGSNYTVFETPASNYLFGGWSVPGQTSFLPDLPFPMKSASLYTATFISNGIPNGLSITYPTSNAIVTNEVFEITGTISNIPSPPVTITCQIYSTTYDDLEDGPLTTTSSPNWSVTANLTSDDDYVVEATAVDAAGNTTIVRQNFTVALAPAIVTPPQSVTNNTGSTAQFTVVADNALSYQWQFQGANISGATNSFLTLEDVNTNEAGAYTVIASSMTLSVTSAPPAILTVTNGTMVQLILSGLTNGNPSNIVNVELFDHDKPATVQNFLHYIRSGAYTNMFFERCVPNYVLQGGSYGTVDRTNIDPPIEGWDIAMKFTRATNQSPPFPAQIANEFGTGTEIHNRFGTMAMALAPNNTNSASSAFFFNLKDNSSSLDGQDFTVFGRIVDSVGTNTLQYFNTLSNHFGIATNTVFYDEALNTTNLTLITLPVDYSGTNPPANADLVYCDFQLPTNAPVDINPPDVTITSPAPGTVTTNLYPIVRGTAADDIGVADISVVLVPQPAPDTNYPNGGVSITNYALGITNWAVTLVTTNDTYIPPGTYDLVAQAQDGAGNLSAAVEQQLIETWVVTNGSGSVTVTGMDAVGYPFKNDSDYTLVATAATNAIFVHWTQYTNVSVLSQSSFEMLAGYPVSAQFITNSMPGALAFTYPPGNGSVGTNAFNVTGTISNVPSPPVTVVCQLFSETSGLAVTAPQTNVVTDSFSFPVNNLISGNYYIVQLVATDQEGHATALSESFYFGPANALQLNIVGPGTVQGATNGQLIGLGTSFDVTAVPSSNGFFYGWSYNLGTNVNHYTNDNASQSFEMQSNLVLTAVFLTNNFSNMIAFTYPLPNAIIGNNAFSFTGTISNVPSAKITLNIFSDNEQLLFSTTPGASGTTTWSIPFAGLPYGQYTAVAQGVDPAGDSSVITESFTVTTNGVLHLATVGTGSISPYTNGAVLKLGTNFQLTATPGAGEAFYNWSDGAQLYSGATQNFTMSYGLSLTATFILTNTAKGISFTYPPPKALLHTNAFTLKGKIAAAMKSARVICQIFQTNGPAAGSPLSTIGTNSWSIDVANLPGGNYVVEAFATNDAGKTTIISETFSILAFSSVQGTYSGLFICTNQSVLPTNSGFLTFTISPYGVMSGKLEFPAYPAIPIYSLLFDNLGFTTGYVSFSLNAFHDHPLLGSIYINLTDGTDMAYGSISSDVWSSEVQCYRAAQSLSAGTTPAVGKYIFSLQSTNETNGLQTNGFASVSVAKNGKLAVAGTLPDNTTFSASSTVSTNGYWPLYAVPAGVKTNGMLMGWETFTNTGRANGQLYWHKAARVGTYYTNGVGVLTNLLLNSPGTNFVRPAFGASYSIVFQGGTLTAPLTNAVSVNKSGQFTVPPGTADKLKITLTANGAITGTIVNPNNKKTLKFDGAFMGPAQGGSGFIADIDGLTGTFTLTPALP